MLAEPIRRLTVTALLLRKLVITTTPPPLTLHASWGHCAKTLRGPRMRCRLPPPRLSAGPALPATAIVAVARATAEPLQEAVCPV